ncbi:MAG: methylated-DNA--[protein]-cysteine S-methyltransferase [Methylacidiphilales bacterium]|nr:methylated-DNA--[protein]-cysteine S-methyltransferase [Candidatus Methylacidiphilales bacterium]
MSSQQELDYQRIEKAILFLSKHRSEQPSLEEVARQAHLSEFHFNRLFKRWAGTTPKQFLQYLTAEHAKQLLRNGNSILNTALESGLSGPGRLHDLFVTCEALTPGEYKSSGKGVEISHGFHPTPFGPCLIATTGKGICCLRFLDGKSSAQTFVEFRKEWPQARFREDQSKTATLIKKIFHSPNVRLHGALRLHLRGTNFQLQVWQALLKIPEGRLVSYGKLADAIHHRKAVRALGTAVGNNPVAYLIPCHRVIRESGALGGYRWGVARKQALIAWESAHVPRVSAFA